MGGRVHRTGKSEWGAGGSRNAEAEARRDDGVLTRLHGQITVAGAVGVTLMETDKKWP